MRECPNQQDIQRSKVGRTVGEAAVALPNCTEIFHKDLSGMTAPVLRGPDLDGVSAFMRNQANTLSNLWQECECV